MGIWNYVITNWLCFGVVFFGGDFKSQTWSASCCQQAFRSKVTIFGWDVVCHLWLTPLVSKLHPYPSIPFVTMWGHTVQTQAALVLVWNMGTLCLTLMWPIFPSGTGTHSGLPWDSIWATHFTLVTVREQKKEAIKRKKFTKTGALPSLSGIYLRENHNGYFH